MRPGSGHRALSPAWPNRRRPFTIARVSTARTAREIQRAAREALGERFATDWCARPPFAEFHPRFLHAIRGFSAWPTALDYDALAQLVPASPTVGAPTAMRAELPRFVSQDREALRLAGGYERHVAQARAVPTREQSWHDFFNMSVWAHFPRVRWALNALHVDDTLGPIDPRNGRAPQQNVASQFDESGLVVASSSAELLAELRALRFKHVFWERRRELLATTRFWVIGHGTLESLLTPHLGLASKAVLLQLSEAPSARNDDELRHEVDTSVARLIDGWRELAPVLDPVPLLGIPGYADNATPQFYDDARYFRFQRRPRR